MGERIDLARHYLSALGGAATSWAKLGETVVRHAAREVPLLLNVERALTVIEKQGFKPSPIQDNFISKTDPVVATYTKETGDRNPTSSPTVGHVRIRRGVSLLAENDGEMRQATADTVRATLQLLSLAPEVAITLILGPKTRS